LGKLSKNFNTLINLGIWDGGEKRQFNSFQDAVDFLSSTHNLSELRVVNKGKFQSEYLKMVNSESK
jgi:hypothetical protein